jgi:hypothetical protein
MFSQAYTPARCWDVSKLPEFAATYINSKARLGCSANYIDDAPEVDDLRWEIPRAAAPITADADLSDWAGMTFKSQTPFRPCDRRAYHWTDPRPPDGTDTCVAPFVEFDVNLHGDRLQTWDGPADHSSAIAFAWTPEALYAGVKVFDDTHENGTPWSPDPSGWSGDSVQFIFANAARKGYGWKQGGKPWPLGSRTTDISDEHGLLEYNFGMRDGAYDLHQSMSPCTEECVEMACERDDIKMITTYEFVFHAHALGQETFKAGFAFGLGLLFNDGDTGLGQGGQSGWSGWGPYSRINAGYSAEDAGLATLVGAPRVRLLW